MADVELSNLVTKVRKLTARPSANQITDAQIVDYINLYYEYSFPQELKVFDFKTNYSFTTSPNQDRYYLSESDRNTYLSFEPPAYCSGYSLAYHQNYETFFSIWPELSTSMTLATATGITGAYTGTLTSLPALKNSVLVSAETAAGTTLTARDDGAGAFYGDATGTINYTTGAVSITFTSAIPSGNEITARWNAYSSGRPLSILYTVERDNTAATDVINQNVFILRPVPDAAYTIQIRAYYKPLAYVAGSSTKPFMYSYFDLLAYGAALKIFADSMEMESYSALRPLYDEQLLLAERKTLMQIKTQRTSTIYDNSGYVSSGNLFDYY